MITRRGLIEGLESPYPMGASLPALYEEPDVARNGSPAGPNFVQRMTSAFDEVLAPVISSLDNLPAYLDPHTAPRDFVEWLASWVGIVLDETWTIERQRTLVARAIPLFGRRGTARGLAEWLAIYAQVEPEIEENGSTRWSATPNTPLPGSPEPRLVVRVRLDADAELDEERLWALISSVKPAHVPAELEVVRA